MDTISLFNSVPDAIALGTSARGSCEHCGNRLKSSFNARFCCLGCEAVYSVLQERGLGKYYDLKSKIPAQKRPLPILNSTENYAYLDDPDFLNLYSWVDPSGSGDRWMEFYVEGVYCVACVWLTEKIPEFVDHVRFIRLNLGSSVATVRVTPEGSFASVAQELLKMGYRPHPVQLGNDRSLQKKETRLLLIRLGIAGMCTGNIMLLAISLYGGATGIIANNFRWLSFFLFVPVLVFSAVPFYKSAWSALRAKQASIDIPVVFGILLGSVVSSVNLFVGSDQIYFDSLSMLVFLLLSTRLLLKKAQQEALTSSHLVNFLTPSKVKRRQANTEQNAVCFEEVKIDLLRPGDHVLVQAGDAIPVDGVVSSGQSSVNSALLTGESNQNLIHKGNLVYAGTVNLDAPLEIEVVQSGVTTRLGRILQNMEEILNKKAPVVVFADRVSRVFVLATVVLSISLFIAGFLGGIQGGWHEGLNRALAIAIVTCPCAFALATPLAFSLALGRLAQAGLLVKGADVLEKLSKVKSVYLDKTGTLTAGTPEVIQWISVGQILENSAVETAVCALESRSNHPIAQALVRYLTPKIERVLPQVEGFKEVIGRGVYGIIDGINYEVRGARGGNRGTEIAIYRSDELVAHVIFGDPVRPQSRSAIEGLRTLGLNPWILSGDNSSAVALVASQVGILPSHCISESSPESKCAIVQAQPLALMVGDGANDSVALAAAHVGIAVHGGVEISMRAAGVYLRSPGVDSIYSIIVIARETMHVVYRNLAFSLVYNICAAIMAIFGKIDPLFAAILMPFSALTVFLSSIAGTRRMKCAFKDLNL